MDWPRSRERDFCAREVPERALNLSPSTLRRSVVVVAAAAPFPARFRDAAAADAPSFTDRTRNDDRVLQRRIVVIVVVVATRRRAASRRNRSILLFFFSRRIRPEVKETPRFAPFLLLFNESLIYLFSIIAAATLSLFNSIYCPVKLRYFFLVIWPRSFS